MGGPPTPEDTVRRRLEDEQKALERERDRRNRERLVTEVAQYNTWLAAMRTAIDAAIVSLRERSWPDAELFELPERSERELVVGKFFGQRYKTVRYPSYQMIGWSIGHTIRDSLFARNRGELVLLRDGTLATGKPLIAWSLDDYAEDYTPYIEDGQVYSFPSGNAESLLREIQKLIA